MRRSRRSIIICLLWYRRRRSFYAMAKYIILLNYAHFVFCEFSQTDVVKATCDERTRGLPQRGIIVVDFTGPLPPRLNAIFSSRLRSHRNTNIFYTPLGKTFIIIYVETILYRTNDILSNATDHHTCTRNV